MKSTLAFRRLRRAAALRPTREMSQVLRRELARAERGGPDVSVVLFTANDHKRPQRLSLRIARAVAARARASDEVGWLGAGVVCVVLHGCTAAGAWEFSRAVCSRVGSVDERQICRVYTQAAEAHEFRDRRQSTSREAVRSASRNRDAVNHRLHGAGTLTVEDALSRLAVPVLQGVSVGSDVQAATETLSRRDLIPYVEQGIAEAIKAHEDLMAHDLASLVISPISIWKRGLDIVVAGTALIMAAPLMLMIAALVKLTSPGGVLFCQWRTGLGGRPFLLYKFRTMVPDAEAKKAALRQFSEQDGPAFKMTHDPRVTRIGRWLRKTSLDELPQLWNVVKGDMSLVGPRPLPCDESAECNAWQSRRHHVPPGLTCIWQVKGRSSVTFTEWMRMDLRYIRQRRFLYDLLLILQTIPAVLRRKGAR